MAGDRVQRGGDPVGGLVVFCHSGVMTRYKRSSCFALVFFVVVSACSSSSGDVHAHTAQEPPGVASEAGEASSSSIHAGAAAGSPSVAHSLAQDSDDEPADEGAGGSAPASGRILDVDFRNDFRYQASFDPERVVEVVNGEFLADDDDVTLRVVDVKYGDLDGDGDQEAVVHTVFNTGGMGHFGRLSVWGIDGDSVVERGWVGAGDRADGGLAHYEIRDRMVLTENYLTDQGACCPNMLIQQRLALTSAGLVSVEHVQPLRWLSLNGIDTPELIFIPGTSAAIVAHQTVDPHELIFEAARGQWLTVASRRGFASAVQVTDPDGDVIGESAAGAIELELPADGFYRLRFLPTGSDTEALTDVSITNHRIVPSPALAVRLRDVAVDVEPAAYLVAAWPEFVLPDSGDLTRQTEDWVAEQTDWWIAGVIDYPPEDRGMDGPSSGGTYELLYEVTLASNDLVSVRWNWFEYVCCRAYPNLGHASLVVDIAERRIVPVDEILDLDRLDEIHHVWISKATNDGVLPEDYLEFAGDEPKFTSVSLNPAGIEFGTDRDGGLSATTTVVPWDALGDLVQPGIADRARSGTAPSRLS